MNPSAAPAAIGLDGVVVAYDDEPVLVEVDLDIEAGELVSLLGPSGCGKTTLLRAIAGLEMVAGGSIRLGDQTVSAKGIHVPAERRRVGMVFQDWALFPHLSVGANVAYGLKGEPQREERVRAVLDMVGLEGFEERSPHTLSGGQQQRVALARALAPEPRVLLLDEPFSNLDAALRVEIRTELHRLLVELDVTAVFVTHDQHEAFVLGDRVAVLRDGRIEQWGPPTELYRQPVNAWVASFVGEANLLRGTVVGESAQTCLGAVPVTATTADAAVTVLVRPEEVALAPLEDAADGAEGRVTLVEYFGRDTVYEVELADGQILRSRLASVPLFEPGSAVMVSHRGGPYMAYAREC